MADDKVRKSGKVTSDWFPLSLSPTVSVGTDEGGVGELDWGWDGEDSDTAECHFVGDKKVANLCTVGCFMNVAIVSL